MITLTVFACPPKAFDLLLTGVGLAALVAVGLGKGPRAVVRVIEGWKTAL